MEASFWEANQRHFIDAAVSLAVLVGAYLIYRGTRKLIDRFSTRRRLAETDPGAETRFRMIEHLLAVVLFFLAVGLVFWIVDVSALKRVAVGIFASAGVAGVALGFAAQTTMANLVSGVIIAFAQPVRLGDTVKIDDELGVVESIGLFYTVIRTWDNRRLVIPNKVLSDRTIRNYTLVDSRLPAIVILRVDYEADIETVRSVLMEEARAHPLFVPDPEPTVQVVDADDFGVSVRLVAWAADPGSAWNLGVDVREKAIARLQSKEPAIWVRWSRVVGGAKEARG